MRFSTWRRCSSRCTPRSTSSKPLGPDRQVSPEVWRRIEDHLDLALDTLEETWKLALERRYALRDVLKAEQAARKLLERTRNVDAQPGSPADIEAAEAMWSVMRTITKMVHDRRPEIAAA